MFFHFSVPSCRQKDWLCQGTVNRWGYTHPYTSVSLLLATAYDSQVEELSFGPCLGIILWPTSQNKMIMSKIKLGTSPYKVSEITSIVSKGSRRLYLGENDGNILLPGHCISLLYKEIGWNTMCSQWHFYREEIDVNTWRVGASHKLVAVIRAGFWNH